MSAPGMPPGPPLTPGSVRLPTGMPWWGWLLIALASGLVALVALLALLGAFGGRAEPTPPPATPEPSGYVYGSADFPFEVTFPGPPERAVAPQSVAGFDLELVTVSWAQGDLEVVLAATEFPAGLLPDGPSDEVLQASLEGAAANVGGVLQDVAFVEVAGERALTGTIRAGSTLYATVLFHDLVQYSLLTHDGTPEQHAAFVESLHFLD